MSTFAARLRALSDDYRKRYDVAGPVLAACRLYGVGVTYGPLHDSVRWGKQSPWVVGPALGAVNLRHRAIWVETPPEGWMPEDRAVYLHELTHILAAHPALGCEGPEDYLQLQFEKALADALGFGECDGVAMYQLNGPLAYNLGAWAEGEDCFESAAQMRAEPWWAEGLERARVAGLLDAEGLPTGRRSPDWSALPAADLARLVAKVTSATPRRTS